MATATDRPMVEQVNREHDIPTVRPTKRVLRVGFVPLTDCVPLVMAQELGLFRKYGLEVTLSRELGWATIRDKIIYGELDAAHAIAGLPLATTLGLDSIPCECLSALILNTHGNAITLSNRLWDGGIRDAETLRREILGKRGQKEFIFGVVHLVSSHHLLLRDWLSAAGINPDRDVRIVVVPPPQMVANLKAGNLDGFCVGEPWTSVAVQAQLGWCPAVSADLAPGHPEKVLMVRRAFAEKQHSEHLALLAALLEACAFCDTPENHELMASILTRPCYVNVPTAALRPGLSHRFDCGHGQIRTGTDFCVFHRHDANEPSEDKVAWILQLLRASRLWPEGTPVDATLRRVFRPDLYLKAVALRDSQNKFYNENKIDTQLAYAGS